MCSPRHSIHNRYQWQRYGQRCDLMWSMRRATDCTSREEVLHMAWLWHGTSVTDPRVLCMGQDGIDFRRVRYLGVACKVNRMVNSWSNVVAPQMTRHEAV